MNNLAAINTTIPTSIETKQNTLPRLRTIPKIVEEIKKLDPESEITVRFVREGIANGKIPVMRLGNKMLARLDDVIAYFDNESSYEIIKPTNSIRRL